MLRPFSVAQAQRTLNAGVARAGSRIADVRGTSAARVRHLGRTFNPIADIPHPIPSRKRRPAMTPVGEETTPQQESAMRNFWWDGLFAEGSEVIWLQFLSLYALALGAGVGVIGLLVAGSNLLAALSMWPGAVLAERTQRYKFIVVLTGGILGRVALLLLALIPWLATGNVALGLLAAAVALRSVVQALAMPAWHAFAAEFVPARLRGRYFASRNFGRQVTELSVAPIVGFVISHAAGFSGWQAAWFAAFMFGVVSSYFYLRIPTLTAKRPPVVTVKPALPRPSALRDRRLMTFVAMTGLFYFSVMLAGPFFAIYLVRELGGSAMWVGITSAALPVGGIVSQPILARLNDRLGPKWLLVTSGLILPIIPCLWILAAAPWHVIFLNLAAGVAWSAFLLGSFNFLLAIAPAHRRPTYSGMHQAAIFFGGFAGPLAGGFLIPLVGYHVIFALSGLGRGVATLMLLRVSAEVEDEVARPPAAVEPQPAPA